MTDQVVLYQFPISHFCEKARWALDYKGVSYKPKNLLPGFHVKPIKQIAAKSSVPTLLIDGRSIQGSAEIISFLDQYREEKPLTPIDPVLAAEAMAWERLADSEVGPQVRMMCYDIVLEYPRAVIPSMAEGGPWYGSLLLKIIFPKLKQRMRSLLKINPGNLVTSRQSVDAVIDRMEERLTNNRFLVGDQFSRADLAMAALFSPLCKPADKDSYNANEPEAFRQLKEEYQSRLPWVSEIYRGFR